MSKHFEGANSYTGTRAHNYDEIRKKKKEWQILENIVFKLLEDITSSRKGLTVLDIPVGTGRFFDVYKKLSFRVVGIDISDDMLKMAQKKSRDVDIRKGNILSLPLDIKPNIVVCVGFLHLITKDDIRKVIDSISKTNAEHVIITALIQTKEKEIGKQVITTATNNMSRIRKLTKDAYQSLLREGMINTAYKIRKFEKRPYPDADMIINEFRKNNYEMEKQLYFGKTLQHTDSIFLFSRNMKKYDSNDTNNE